MYDCVYLQLLISIIIINAHTEYISLPSPGLKTLDIDTGAPTHQLNTYIHKCIHRQSQRERVKETGVPGETTDGQPSKQVSHPERDTKRYELRHQ